MNRLLYLITATILLATLTTHAQRASYYKRVFVDAEYYLLYEEYKEALPLYKEILRSHPSNANISFRIGQCYLNIPNEKEKAIPFLENAIKDVSTSYREGYFTEQQSPREAFLLLGIAYRAQSDFDKAKQFFSTYLSVLKEEETRERELVRNEIASIALAKRMKENPVDVVTTNAGRFINTRFNDLNPLASADNQILIFTSEQQFYNAIMMSTRENNEWTHPINLNSQLLADGNIHAVSLSSNAQTLLLARLDNDIYNLYINVV